MFSSLPLTAISGAKVQNKDIWFAIVQVRDVLGDGRLIKRRVKDGKGFVSVLKLTFWNIFHISYH